MRHVPSLPSAAAVRLALVRFPLLRRAVQAAVATLVAVGIWHGVRSTEVERRSWGDTAEVVVALRDLEAGTTIGDGDVRTEAWPIALVPAGVVPAPEVGTQVRQHVRRGEVLVDHDLAAEGPAGLVRDGQQAVTIRVDPDVLAALGVGDPVGVVVAGEQTATGRVVAVGASSVTVAVPRSAAPGIADATLLGTATVVLGG